MSVRSAGAIFAAGHSTGRTCAHDCPPAKYIFFEGGPSMSSPIDYPLGDERAEGDDASGRGAR